MKIDDLYRSLQNLRCPFSSHEEMIHKAVAQCLDEAHIHYTHEAQLGPCCRIDFLVNGVGIEIKKGKPNRKLLISQLQRYTACASVDAMILISPYTVDLPSMINHKPIRCICLNILWGVALS